MAMHVVLGDGDMSSKELVETLKDLWEETPEGDAFWFTVQGKPEPTDTDTNLVKWITKNEIYFEVVTADADAMDRMYSAASEVHTVKRLGQKIVNLLNTKPEGEAADVLALFVSEDPGAEEDRWLNTIIQQTTEAGFPAYALNDGMAEIDVDADKSDDDDEDEETEEVAPAKTTASKRAAKSAAPAKKAAAKAAPAEDDEDEQDEPSTASTKYTRDDLEEMELDELKEIAKAKGIELPPRTRMTTYIDHILGEADGAPTAEVSKPAVTTTTINGNQVEELAERVLAVVVERLTAALQG